MIAPASKDAEFSISDLAAEFGVTARALRFYEAKGLLRPERRGQTRVYTANDRARLNLILRGKRVGFTLDEVKEMLDIENVGDRGRSAVHAAIERFQQRIALLQRQRADIDAAVRDLAAGLAWLESRAAEREPSEDVKTRAAAFEALARSWIYGGESSAAAE